MHDISDGSGSFSRTLSNNNSGDTAVDDYSFYFGKEVRNYPQPLTFTIERYWNPIMDTQDIELY